MYKFTFVVFIYLQDIKHRTQAPDVINFCYNKYPIPNNTITTCACGSG